MIPPLSLLMAGWLAASGGAGDASVDLEAVGPQVGEAVPAFELVDQLGRSRDLASIAGPRGTMLVFSRSADW